MDGSSHSGRRVSVCYDFKSTRESLRGVDLDSLPFRKQGQEAGPGSCPSHLLPSISTQRRTLWRAGQLPTLCGSLAVT